MTRRLTHDEAFELAPTHLAYANLGWLYLLERRYSDSATATENALAISDKDWRSWTNLLVAYIWLNDEKKIPVTRAKAIAALEHYALLDSKEATVQSTLGAFYAEDKQREKAIAHANAALSLDPKNPGAGPRPAFARGK